MVLGDTEDTWKAIFQRMNRQYREPTLVLFSGGGRARRAAWPRPRWGPSTARRTTRSTSTSSFYRDLRDRLGAPGDFAQAYVIAHEVGHHVQNLLGHRREACTPSASASATAAGATRSRCGWSSRPTASPVSGPHNAQRARQILEAGDVEEGLNAAAAIGDDRLQRRSQGTVVPESFTHGSLRAARALVQARHRAGRARRLRHVRRPGACDG